MTETSSRSPGSVGVRAADALAPVLQEIFGTTELPLAMRFWDGSTLGPAEAPATVVLRSPMALRRLLYSPGELGFARAFVTNELDIEGDLYAGLDLRSLMGATRDKVELKLTPKAMTELAVAVRKLGIFGRPPPAPREEAHLRGRKHSRFRDRAAISHHYDVSNDFYRLFLGETMTYSCGYWTESDIDNLEPGALDRAQTAKYDHICKKLALRPGQRLLDVGCGWGGMVLHAAKHYGVNAVGVTIAQAQADLARERVAAAGLTDHIEIRLQDYRDIADGPYDAISSIGMFEHVGLEGLKPYFSRLLELLTPTGRLLNHAISSPDTDHRPVSPRSFIGRYVFPDGQLLEVGETVTAMQDLGFEVRDVESLREHYAKTLRAWVANLESNWETAVASVGSVRSRVWRLYMAASAVNFEANRTAIHQVLAVKPTSEGYSAMPATRAWIYQR